MKIYENVEQGSADWFNLRIGIPTASCFDQIITPKTGQLSKSADRYALRLIAERLLNAPMETVDGQHWMERGKDLEPLAVKQYEWVNEVETRAVGFITNDAGTLGASPDRLINGQPAGLEVKCPAPHTHLGYLLNGAADDYRPQVQGQLYVAELERVDLYSFHPRMPACTIQTHRDETFLKLLVAALDQFNDRLLMLLERAQSLGFFQAYTTASTPSEVEHANQLTAEFKADFGLVI